MQLVLGVGKVAKLNVFLVQLSFFVQIGFQTEYFFRNGYPQRNIG